MSTNLGLTQILNEILSTAQSIDQTAKAISQDVLQNTSTLFQLVPGFHQYKYMQTWLQNLGYSIDAFDFVVLNMRKYEEEKANASSGFVDVITELTSDGLASSLVDPTASEFVGYAFSLRKMLQVLSSSNAAVKYEVSGKVAFYRAYVGALGLPQDFVSSITGTTDFTNDDTPNHVLIGISMPSTSYPDSPIFFAYGVEFDPNNNWALKYPSEVNITSFITPEFDVHYPSIPFVFIPAVADSSQNLHHFPYVMWAVFASGSAYIRSDADYAGTNGQPESDFAEVFTEAGFPLFSVVTGHSDYKEVRSPPYATFPFGVSLYGATSIRMSAVPVPPYAEPEAPTSS